MSVKDRAKLIGKLQASLKKYYKPVDAGSRPLLDHILYASLLQDATYEMADEGIAKCEQDFYDWNEVRVTTVTELSQVLSHLPDPVKAATRLKGNLLEVFEEFFTFDIDHLKKDNLGKAVAKFEKMSQMTPFVLSYAVQHGLGGHSIPIDYAALVVMLSTGIVEQSEAAEGRVPGLERAIPKTKGVEFGSLLHQCAVALLLDPKDKTARTVLDETDSGASKRFDEWSAEKEAAKKRVKKRKTSERKAAKKAAEMEAAEVDEPPVKSKSTGKSKAAAKPKAPTKPKSAEKPKATAPAGDQASAEETVTAPVKKATKPTKPKTATKKTPVKKAAAKSDAAAETDAKKTSPKKSAAKSPAAAKKAPAKKSVKKSAGKADNRKLTKKKPR